MKLFGSIKELVSAVFRKDTYEITLRPNQSTTYTAARDVQLPAKDGNAVLVSSGDIVNTDINASAAIAYSKLALSNSIVNADVSSTAAVAYSKLNLSGSIVNADISNTAAIDATKIGTGVVSNTEFGYLDGVTSAIQTQLNGKQATITGAATTITSSDLSASKALQSDASGKVAASSVTSTELGYVSGVTSAIQTQLNNKAAKGANSDITSLSGLTTALSIGQGGTGQTTQQAALTALAGTQVSGQYLRSNGTNTLLSAIQAADVPTLNQNTTGTAANVTGTVAIGNGGTGQTTANAALNALLPSQASAANKYLKSDGTNTSWASASGGAGEINAILNSSGADGTTGWTGTSVVTGSNSPLNPIVTTAFSISNAATTESSTSGGYYPFTLPTGLMNRKLKIEFSYTTPATDVYKVSVYKGSTRVALSTDSSGSTSLPASVTGGKFVAYFDTDNSSSWTVSVTRTSGTTGPAYITNVIVGPGIQPQGAVVGEWVSYTPTLNSTTNVSKNIARYRRVGSVMHLSGTIEWNGAGAAGNLSIGLGGLTLDTAQLNSAAVPYLGSGELYNNTNYTTLAVVQDTSTATSIKLINTGTGVFYASSSSVSGYRIDYNAQIPIAEWAGSGTVQLAQNDVEYAASTSGTWDAAASAAQTVYGPAGAPITGALGANRIKVVQFQSPIQAGDSLVLEFKNPNGVWVPAANTIYNYTWQKNATFGARLTETVVGATTVEVSFSQYGAAGQTYGTADATSLGWSTSFATAWRVRKSSAGAAVGFGIVSPGVSSGLVSAAGLPGNTTGNVIAQGYVGERKVSTSTTAVTTGGVQVNSLSLEAGIWLINAVTQITADAALREVYTVISTTANTIPAFSTDGAKSYGHYSTSNGIGFVQVHSFYVNLAATTTYYQNSQATSVSGLSATNNRMQAIRIA